MGTQVQVTRRINASIAPTWAAISEMKALENWHPNVAHSHVLSDRVTGIGASRRVEFQNGKSVVETVIDESEAHFTTMELTEAEPLKKAVVTIRAEQRSENETDVTFSIDFDIGLGPIGWLVEVLMMKRVFAKVFGIALDGLSYHLETGKLVGTQCHFVWWDELVRRACICDVQPASSSKFSVTPFNPSK